MTTELGEAQPADCSAGSRRKAAGELKAPRWQCSYFGLGEAETPVQQTQM